MTEKTKALEMNRLYQALFTGLLVTAIHDHTDMRAKPSLVYFDDGVDAGQMVTMFIEDRDREFSASIMVNLDTVDLALCA